MTVTVSVMKFSIAFVFSWFFSLSNLNKQRVSMEVANDIYCIFFNSTNHGSYHISMFSIEVRSAYSNEEFFNDIFQNDYHYLLFYARMNHNFEND